MSTRTQSCDCDTTWLFVQGWGRTGWWPCWEIVCTQMLCSWGRGGVEGAEAEAEVDGPESSGAWRLAEAPVPLKKLKPLCAWELEPVIVVNSKQDQSWAWNALQGLPSRAFRIGFAGVEGESDSCPKKTMSSTVVMKCLISRSCAVGSL